MKDKKKGIRPPTIYEVAQKLIDAGNKVTLYKRKDGGYLITSINGIKYTGAKGNNLARQLTGSALTETQLNQRINITQKRIQYETNLGKEIKKQFRQTRKALKESEIEAKITMKQVNRIIEKEGKKEALEHLKEIERHAQGYAYAEYVNKLISDLEDKFQPIYPVFGEVINYLKANMYTLRHKAVERVHYIMYEISKVKTHTKREMADHAEAMLNILKNHNL